MLILRRLLRLVAMVGAVLTVLAAIPVVVFWPDYDVAPLAPFVLGGALIVTIAAMQLLYGLAHANRPRQNWRGPGG